jgi:hypothetical protein
MRRWVLALLACGCSTVRDARSAADAMRSSACRGDVVGFFRYVDRTAILRHVEDAAINEGASKVASKLGVTERVALDTFKQSPQAREVETFATARFQRLTAQWEDDVKKGKDGGLCAISFLSDWTKDATGEVWLRYQNGVEWVWVFTRFGDATWMLTELVRPEKRRG